MEHRPKKPDIRTDEGCPKGRDITSFTISLPLQAEAVGGGAPHSAVAAADKRPDGATPTLAEVFGTEKRRLLKILAKFQSNRSGSCKTAAEQKCAAIPSRRYQKRTSGHF